MRSSKLNLNFPQILISFQKEGERYIDNNWWHCVNSLSLSPQHVISHYPCIGTSRHIKTTTMHLLSSS